MAPHMWLGLVLCVAHWICPVSLTCRGVCSRRQHCLKENRVAFIVSDDYTGTVKCQREFNGTCLMMLSRAHQNVSMQCRYMGLALKQTSDGSTQLLVLKSLFQELSALCVLSGKNCSATSLLDQIQGGGIAGGGFQQNNTENCTVSCFTNQTCREHLKDTDERYCERVKDILGFQSSLNYMINITSPQSNCYTCKNKGMKPEEDFDLQIQLGNGNGAEIDPVMAVELMKNLTSLVSKMRESSASVSVGATKGVVVKQNEISAISVGYTLPNYTVLIADDVNDLSTLTSVIMSVFISKEAFENAYKCSASAPFAGVFRFHNMGKDEVNSTVLLNEVIAIDMGTTINNLTDQIIISFRKGTEKGKPSCRSWNGEGRLPNWTDNGCDTLVNGDSVTCHCSHLTFFAVIMSPPDQPISAADLHSLTYITYIGCGLSIFFLGIAFFMHFLTRKTKTSQSKDILIQLMIALFLLNLCFLTNVRIANHNSPMGCRVMASLMHYSMLATFMWFAMNAFHLCLHLKHGGKIGIHHYIRKVSVVAWVTPCLVVTAFLILGKYGPLATTSEDNEIAMCWITDDELHYVNITYYAVVFLFTFTTFILILFWIKMARVGAWQMASRSSDIVSVFGLCLTLGVSWGVAFFAHGVLLLPSYYIFTILNSFQGFFLFLYYYKTSHTANEVQNSGSSSSSQNITTVE